MLAACWTFHTATSTESPSWCRATLDATIDKALEEVPQLKEAVGSGRHGSKISRKSPVAWKA